MATSLRRTHDGQEEDELPFGDFCFSCGNATQGTPYCSADCRKADLERSEHSPDFSPSLEAVPPLVPSTKSVCSTPPSSDTNSPSPLNGITSDLADPPSLDLPPPKHRFEYGGQSLPNVAMRFPSTWTINYQADPLASPVVAPTEVHAVPMAKEMSYRRRPNRPQAAVPSPLYFRQKAAAVHSSPAFGPTSPATRFVPLHPHTDYSGADIHEDDIAAFSLSGKDEAPPAPFVPTVAHCGRPGCVGALPTRPRIDTSVAGATGKGGRRQSWQGHKALTPIETAEDVLMSPRIRALRSGRSETDENRQPLRSPSASAAEDDDSHSAFACYLFSHLTSEPAPAPPERGRSASIDQSAPDMQRSRSVDAALAIRPAVSNSSVSASPSPARAVRPIRGMLGGRGPAANAVMRSEPALQPLTNLAPSTSPSSPASSSRSRAERPLDRDATIRPPKDRNGGSVASRCLIPGHFINATAESLSSSVAASPFASPPPSPPTAGRGRSSTRRFSNTDPSGLVGLDGGAVESPNPRGRSKLRGFGAVQRSMSPSARKESPSPSPARSPSRGRGGRSRSRSRSRTQTRNASRTSYSRGRGGAREEGSPRRGRTRERTLREEDEEEDADEEDERGRGRGRARDSRSRSRSKLRRGRGNEVIYSMAAYGHCESSDEERGR
ncbi:hypothetical protein JCM8097_008745 [Rhodosporidiobolus ruineniae]